MSQKLEFTTGGHGRTAARAEPGAADGKAEIDRDLEALYEAYGADGPIPEPIARLARELEDALGATAGEVGRHSGGFDGSSDGAVASDVPYDTRSSRKSRSDSA